MQWVLHHHQGRSSIVFLCALLQFIFVYQKIILPINFFFSSKVSCNDYSQWLLSTSYKNRIISVNSVLFLATWPDIWSVWNVCCGLSKAERLLNSPTLNCVFVASEDHMTRCLIPVSWNTSLLRREQTMYFISFVLMNLLTLWITSSNHSVEVLKKGIEMESAFWRI